MKLATIAFLVAALYGLACYDDKEDKEMGKSVFEMKSHLKIFIYIRVFV